MNIGKILNYFRKIFLSAVSLYLEMIIPEKRHLVFSFKNLNMAESKF